MVGPVKKLQEQWILGVTSPTGPVSVLVSIEACLLKKRDIYLCQRAVPCGIEGLIDVSEFSQ